LYIHVYISPQNFQSINNYQQFSIAFDIPANACTSPGPDTTKQTAGLKNKIQKRLMGDNPVTMHTCATTGNLIKFLHLTKYKTKLIADLNIEIKLFLLPINNIEYL
jgi:hypothetical protein